MKVFAINGSPRKKHNTAMLLESALEGAKSKGAETKLVNLYDLDFKGCTSCLACKLKTNEENGLCAMKDDITDLLAELAEADAVIVGSPIYFADVTSATRAFIERFAYPYFLYTKPYSTKYKGKMKTAFIYNMNTEEEIMESRNYAHNFETLKGYMGMIFGHSEYITVTDTMQMNDYSRHITDSVDPVKKAESRKEKFPKDRQRAFDLGASLTA